MTDEWLQSFNLFRLTKHDHLYLLLLLAKKAETTSKTRNILHTKNIVIHLKNKYIFFRFLHVMMAHEPRCQCIFFIFILIYIYIITWLLLTRGITHIQWGNIVKNTLIREQKIVVFISNILSIVYCSMLKQILNT